MARYSTAGLKLQRSTDGTTYVDVGQVLEYSISGAQKEQIEATALDDTARVYVDGLPGFGQVQLTVAWDPASVPHQNLFADFSTSNLSRYWKILHPIAGTVGDKTFQGPMIGYSESASPNSVHQAAFTIQVSGAIANSTV